MTTAILVAAGAGTRLGDGPPKALRELGGRPLLLYSLATLSECPAVDAAVVVVPDSHTEQARQLIEPVQNVLSVTIVPGGAHRHESVLSGLMAAPDRTDWVAVHDAARPFATTTLFAAVIEAAQQAGGAIAAHRASDTLKRESGGRVLETVARDEIWMAETPQVFPREDLIDAIQSAAEGKRLPTDEAQAMEWRGKPVALIENRSLNLKLTTAADWQYAEYLIRSATEQR